MVCYHFNLCYQVLTDKCVITNEVGTAEDVLAVVKRANSAKVVNLFTSPVSKTELAVAA